MIQLTGAAKRFGPKTLFENLDWLVTPNERAGIVGVKVDADPLHGRYELMAGGKRAVLEFEPDSELRASEQFTGPCYQPKPPLPLDELRAAILAVRTEAEGLLDELVQGAAK